MQHFCTAIFLATYVFMAASFEEIDPSKKVPKGDPTKMKAPKDQHYFKIVLRKIEMNATFGEFIGDKTHFSVVMYNDSLPVMNGKIDLLTNMPRNLMIQVQGSRYATSNQWIPTFDQGKKAFCDYFKDNTSFMKNIMIASDFKECPFEQGLYTISNMVVDEKAFPPGLPDCKFKIDAIFTIGIRQIGQVIIYADVVQNDDYDD